eukprot:COSAG02_NODE_4453_length_5342_cov_5.823956_2_plen_150_part_00
MDDHLLAYLHVYRKQEEAAEAAQAAEEARLAEEEAARLRAAEASARYASPLRFLHYCRRRRAAHPALNLVHGFMVLAGGRSDEQQRKERKKSWLQRRRTQRARPCLRKEMPTLEMTMMVITVLRRKERTRTRTRTRTRRTRKTRSRTLR